MVSCFHLTRGFVQDTVNVSTERFFALIIFIPLHHFASDFKVNNFSGDYAPGDVVHPSLGVGMRMLQKSVMVHIDPRCVSLSKGT